MNGQAVERRLDAVDQRLSVIESEQRRQAGDIAEMKELLKVMYPLAGGVERPWGRTVQTYR